MTLHIATANPTAADAAAVPAAIVVIVVAAVPATIVVIVVAAAPDTIVVVVVATVHATVGAAAYPAIVHFAMVADTATRSATACHTGRTAVRTSEVATGPTVMQSYVYSARSTEVAPAAVVVASAAMQVPGMSATVGCIEVWTAEVEIVTIGIAGIHAEVPVTGFPVEGTVEVAGGQIGIPLPVEQDIAQVEVTALPIGSEHVMTARHSHQIVEVDLVGGLILLIGQVELVGHLVGQEQGLVAGLLIAHCAG